MMDDPTRRAALVAALLRPADDGPREDDPPPPTRSKLRMVSVGDRAMDRFRALVGSPFADSLNTLVGSPSVVSLEPRDTGDLGEYAAARSPSGKVTSDTVYLTPELLRRHVGTDPQGVPRMGSYSPEYTLAHEMGHRERATGQAPDAVRQQDSVMFEQYKKTLPAKYWTVNSDEHYAESFANALTYLRETAREQPTPQAQQRLSAVAQRFEQAVPGTMLQVDRLLKKRLFAHHPLNQITTAPIALSDATRVKR